jgi:uncharacterized membrane protein YqiK
VRGAVAQVEKTQSETAKNMAQAQATDPSAQMELEHAKAEHSAGLAQEKQEHGMAMAERKQAFGEQMAVRNADKPTSRRVNMGLGLVTRLSAWAAAMSGC